MTKTKAQKPSSRAAFGVLIVGLILLAWAVVEAIVSSPNAGRFGAATGFVLVGGLIAALGSRGRRGR